MAEYTVTYHNETSFMKEWTSNPTIKTDLGNDKSKPSNMTYKKTNVPGTKVYFHPKFVDGSIQIALTQDEVNACVSRMSVYDDKGNQIKEAPLKSLGHPFWRTETLGMWIEGGKCKLNDADDKQKLILASMRKDREFYFVGESDKPYVPGVHKWKVSQIGGKHTEEVRNMGEVMKATEYLIKMDYQKQIAVSKAMNEEVAPETDPTVLQAKLFKLITVDKDIRIYNGGPTYLQKFLSLCTANEGELNVQRMVFDGKKKLFNKKNGMVKYGEVQLGRTDEEIIAKLKADNELQYEIYQKLYAVEKD